jgi:UDP-N-acetylglucosamine transferase subunit ALG13
VIFATVGTQLPFPRLMAALDAEAAGLGEPILAQTREDPARYPALNAHATLAPADFEAAFARARLIVAHAGIGTILAARRHEKPLVLLPRRHALGEHRNDHQMATARHVQHLDGIYIAWNAENLKSLITQKNLAKSNNNRSNNLQNLINYIKDSV